ATLATPSTPARKSSSIPLVASISSSSVWPRPRPLRPPRLPASPPKRSASSHFLFTPAECRHSAGVLLFNLETAIDRGRDAQNLERKRGAGRGSKSER